MATVPHAVPSRLSHLTAELYGREDDTLIAWQRTCTQVSEALRTHHAGDRLGKALALAQEGAVELESDGFAVVTSGTRLYHVQTDGTCDCPDYSHRGAPCKHVLAVLIHTRAHELLEPSPSAEAAVTPATPPRPVPPRPTPASAQAVPTAATWHVRDAQTSACMRWRIGTMDVTYTIRGTTDAEVIDRIDATLQRLHDLFEVHEMRAAECAAARDAALAQAQQAQPTPALTPEALQALQVLLAASPVASNGAAANGHTPAAPPRCPAHGDMRESTKKPGTWFCPQKLPDGTYCATKA